MFQGIVRRVEFELAGFNGKKAVAFVCKYEYCLSNLGLSGEEEIVAGDVSHDKTFHIRVRWKHISG